ncbi:MAG: hypothetical protein R3F46_16580, partial [bacterium]
MLLTLYSCGKSSQYEKVVFDRAQAWEGELEYRENDETSTLLQISTSGMTDVDLDLSLFTNTSCFPVGKYVVQSYELKTPHKISDLSKLINKSIHSPQHAQDGNWFTYSEVSFGMSYQTDDPDLVSSIGLPPSDYSPQWAALQVGLLDVWPVTRGSP